MIRRDLVAQIDDEIEQAQRLVGYWTKQLELQLRTELEDSLRAVVKLHETTLHELRTARQAIIDA